MKAIVYLQKMYNALVKLGVPSWNLEETLWQYNSMPIYKQ